MMKTRLKFEITIEHLDDDEYENTVDKIEDLLYAESNVDDVYIGIGEELEEDEE